MEPTPAVEPTGVETPPAVQETAPAQPAQNPEPAPGGTDLDYSNPEQMKALITDLRKENAGYRTKNKELSSEYTGLNERFSQLETGLKGLFGEGETDLSPEEQVQQLQGQNESLAINQALTEAALEYDVSKVDYPYFKFLVTNALTELPEDGELSEEDVQELAKQAKARSASSTTSIVEGGPAPQAPGAISLAEFKTMGINARSKLHFDNKPLYEQLLAQERQG